MKKKPVNCGWNEASRYTHTHTQNNDNNNNNNDDDDENVNVAHIPAAHFYTLHTM